MEPLVIIKKMKKYLIILSIFFVSCSTIKIEEQIVQDFIKEKNLNRTQNTDASYLIEEAGSNENVLEYYKIAYLDRDSIFHNRRIDSSPRNLKVWPINIAEIEELKSIYKNDTLGYHWKLKNFNSLDIPIIKRKEFDSKIANQSFSLNTSGNVISKPIISENKMYALLYYYSFVPMASIDKKICLVKKAKDKWVVIAEFYDPNVFN